MLFRPIYLILILALYINCAQPAEESTSAISEPPGTEHEGKAFTFDKIQDDIYHARGTGSMSVGCNTTVIINEEDVMLVDSHISPAAIWVLMDELQEITPKPIKYVVNTHFHFDHAHGNQMFPDDVEIIGHEYTRDMLAAGNSKRGRSYESFIGTLPGRISQLEQQVNGAADDSAKADLEGQLARLQTYKAATDAVVPKAPNVTLKDSMTVTRGGREIQLHFLGRAHTGGDVVVFLPEEKIVVTGDMFTGGLSYMGDGYITEWVDTLERLKGLEFDTILPGHGRAFSDREKIDHFQEYLRDLWPKLVAMHEEGVSAEEAAKQIDMTNHNGNYANIREPGVSLHTVLRAYGLLNGEEE